MTTGDVAAEARRLPPEPTAPWIRALVVAVTVVWLAVLGWQVTALPERVPIHFDSGGEADGWSSRAEALAFSALLPLALAYPLPLLSKIAVYAPDWINSSNRKWWIATAPRLRRFERLQREDLWLITASLVLLLAAVQASIVVAARSPDESISQVFLFGPLAVFLVVLVVVVARMFGSRYAEQDVD